MRDREMNAKCKGKNDKNNEKRSTKNKLYVENIFMYSKYLTDTVRSFFRFGVYRNNIKRSSRSEATVGGI